MEQDFLHLFSLSVEGLDSPLEFPMFYGTDDAAEATDAFSKWVARQEDNFLLAGETMAVRANRVFAIRHLSCERR